MRPRRGFRLKNNSWLHFPEKNACFLFEANSRRKQKKRDSMLVNICVYIVTTGLKSFGRVTHLKVGVDIFYDFLLMVSYNRPTALFWSGNIAF